MTNNTNCYDYYASKKYGTNNYQKIKDLAVKTKPVKKYVWNPSWEDKYWIFGKGKKYNICCNNYDYIYPEIDISTLIYWSFGLKVQIQLISPYYSWDDDYFYPIDNPVRKEKVLKVPYISWTQWKWFMLENAKKLVQKDFEESKYSQWINKIMQIWRMFGSWNEDFLKFIEWFEYKDKEGWYSKITEIKDFDKKIKEYLVFEMWIMVEFSKDNLNEFISKKAIFDSRRWRITFLPSLFGSISLEVINPHNKKTRAWTSPIHFETIAQGETSDIKLYYVPFDLIWKSEKDIKKEVDKDIQFLSEIMKEMQKNWIWAKNKYNWWKYNYLKDTEEKKSKFLTNDDFEIDFLSLLDFEDFKEFENKEDNSVSKKPDLKKNNKSKKNHNEYWESTKSSNINFTHNNK